MRIIIIVILYVNTAYFCHVQLQFDKYKEILYSTWGSPILTETSNLHTYVSTKWREGLHMYEQ